MTDGIVALPPVTITVSAERSFTSRVHMTVMEVVESGIAITAEGAKVVPGALVVGVQLENARPSVPSSAKPVRSVLSFFIID